MPGNIKVFGPRDPRPLPEGDVNINVTSRSKNELGRSLSPFNLGPVPLYWGLTAKKMENAWQFSKVYRENNCNFHRIDWGLDGKTQTVISVPSPKWWKWALEGFNDSWAHRYPMGKGAKPLYSFWAGENLDYIAARKKIYVPLYAYCAKKTQAFRYLQQEYQNGKDVYIWDFDGYDYKSKDMTIEDVLNDPKKIMGHGHVLAMMLEAPELVPKLETK